MRPHSRCYPRARSLALTACRWAVITPDTPLEELEKFLDSDGVSFALVTDGSRKFVLGLVTREDLKKCVLPSTARAVPPSL